MKNGIRKFGRWALARLRERSTMAGLAVLAGIIGGPAVGVAAGKVVTGLGLVLGTGLAAATTRPHDDAPG